MHVALLFAIGALAAFATALSVALGAAPTRAVVMHVALALGAMPLILSAMLYFVPVLTRTRSAGAWAAAIPLAALTAAAGVVHALARAPHLIPLAAGVAALAAAGVLWWSVGRARSAISPPHPCLYWYIAALGCLLAALLAVIAATIWPAHWAELRRLHLHLNLLGFVGLTAFGTLQVLLPTAGAYADPAAAVRLRRHLPATVAGTLCVAVGAAWYAPLAWLGLALWLAPVAIFIAALLRRGIRGVTALAGAAGGWAAALLLGALHAAAAVDAQVALGAFFLFFLFPLVTGATGHLIPVWRWPAGTTLHHRNMRALLARASAVRTLGFWTAGGILFVAPQPALWLALALLVLYAAQVVYTVTRSPAR